jgi:ribosomal 50S subunit-recycling heat shock protein
LRIDKFLKVSRIIKRRTVAKESCEKGRIKINDKAVKPGAEVVIGDMISIETGSRVMRFKIKDIREHVKKEEAADLFEEIFE